MRVVWMTACLAVCASTANANDDTERLDCRYTTTCDQDGVCKPNQERIIFELEAQDVGLHGDGAYLIRYEGKTEEAFISDPYAPIRWGTQEGDDVLFSTLFATGDNTMLWVQIGDKDPEGWVSTIHFLTCEEPT
jgi:hypothetical protein